MYKKEIRRWCIDRSCSFSLMFPGKRVYLDQWRLLYLGPCSMSKALYPMSKALLYTSAWEVAPTMQRRSALFLINISEWPAPRRHAPLIRCT